MANIYYDVRVDISKGQVVASGHSFTKGDSSQYLRIAVMNGSSFFNDENAVPQIVFKKPDGNIVTGTPSKVGGLWEYKFQGTELSAAGRVVADVKFTYSSGRISSGKFDFYVEPDTLDGIPNAAGSYISEFKKILDMLDGAKAIETISKTNTEGLIDTYTILYTDGTFTTFEVTNGADGADGIDGADGTSLTAESSKVGKVTTVYIKNAETGDTVTSFEIRDGADGDGAGDMTKATYDTNNNGVVDNAEGLSNGTNVLSYDDISDAIGNIPSAEDKTKWNNHVDELVMSENGVHGLRYNGTSLYAKDNEGIEHEIKTGGTGGSNENLADNAWFTVNQRGSTTYGGVSNQYTVDRWYFSNANGNLQINDDNSIDVWGKGQNACYLRNTCEREIEKGKIYTLSAIIKGTANGYISVNKTPTDTRMHSIVTVGFQSSEWELKSITFVATEDYTPQIVIRNGEGTRVSVKAVKLEPSSVSTLANDVAPDYATELLKCQRYYYRIQGDHMNFITPYVYTNARIYGSLILPTTMRTTPVLNTDIVSNNNGLTVVLNNTKFTVNPSRIYLDKAFANFIKIGITLPSANEQLIVNNVCYVETKSQVEYIEFSADL